MIIPVYQAEKFLKGCVESVRKQTFSDWELLLVDDCSRDGSPALCDSCAAEDDRIRVYHKTKNGGVSEARNLGLGEAKGDYIAFLDADDRYEPSCLETLWSLTEETGADSAACAHLNLWPDGACDTELVLPAGVYDGEGIRKGIVYPLLGDRLTQPVFNGFIWRYLYSARIIRDHQIRFEGAYLEDELFLMEYFCCARLLAVTDQPLYRYLYNPASATRKYMLSSQKIHRLLGNCHLADGVFRFGHRHGQHAVDAGDLLVHRQDAALHVQILPQQSHQLAPAQAAGQLQIEDGQHAISLSLPQIGSDLLRRYDLHFCLVLLWDAATVAGVIRNEPLFYRLLQAAV